MSGEKYIAGALGTEEKLFLGRARDMAKRAFERGFFVYGNFMSAGELSLLEVDEQTAGCFSVYGGYDEAERVVAAFGSEEIFGYPPSFPVRALCINCRSEKYAEPLTHRDYLGALVGLGISRDALGDIIVREDHGAYVFCLDKMAEYICSALVKVRRTDVEVRNADEAMASKIKREYENRVVVAASDRLDALAAAVFGLSRAAAHSLAEKGLIFVNGIAVPDPSFRPSNDSVISVRGSGKFVYRQVCGNTGSGRVRVNVDIYK